MVKIKYLDNKLNEKKEKFHVGDFVSIPETTDIVGCDFGIITDAPDSKKGWSLTVIDLDGGEFYGQELRDGGFDNISDLVKALHPVHITEPFVVYPKERQSDD